MPNFSPYASEKYSDLSRKNSEEKGPKQGKKMWIHLSIELIVDGGLHAAKRTAAYIELHHEANNEGSDASLHIAAIARLCNRVR